MIEKVILKKFAFLSFEQYSLFDILNSYILWKSAEAQFPQRREREKSGEDYTIYREVLSDLRGREGRGAHRFSYRRTSEQFTFVVWPGGGDLSSSGLFSARRVSKNIRANWNTRKHFDWIFSPLCLPPPPQRTRIEFLPRGISIFELPSHPRGLH